MTAEPWLPHFTAGALLVARSADLVSTFMVSPSLRLEMNPLMRRFGWPFGFATLLLCVVPYAHVGAGLALTVASFLVAGRNFAQLWSARAFGEDELLKQFAGTARRTRLSDALIGTQFAFACLGAVGVLVTFLSYQRDDDLGFWCGIGIVAYVATTYSYVRQFLGNLYASVTKKSA